MAVLQHLWVISILIGILFTGPLKLLSFVSGALLVLTGVFVLSIPDNYSQSGGPQINLSTMDISLHSFSALSRKYLLNQLEKRSGGMETVLRDAEIIYMQNY
jgi:hypothetical protein